MHTRNAMRHYSSERRLHRLRRLFTSIKGQIFIVFTVTFLSVLALTVLHMWSVSTVKARLLLGVQYYALLNNILEMRRCEKNYLFYNDANSLEEGASYLKNIERMVTELAPDVVMVTDRKTLDAFKDALTAYEKAMTGFSPESGAPIDREEIRQRGKTLTDFADHLLEVKQGRIEKALNWTSLLPFAFWGIFIWLMLLVIKLISQGLLRPLGVLQNTIQRVAKGDYSPTAYEGIHTDEISGLIGAFNRMASELEANQEDLLQARKIAALGTFTAGIAHELNNPINNIHLTAETYVEEYSDGMDADAKELLHDVIVQAERAADIVKNLLDFSRTEHPTLTALDAHDIVRSTVSLVKNQIMLAAIHLDLEIKEGLPRVRGNLRNLQQVFMNLLLNAIQAMSDGGEITIRVEAESPDFVRFDVRDTGAGIKPESLPHIFEPFFTTKGAGRGTGLGLAVTYSIVQRHGGRIEVKSKLGEGTTFSVYLPVSRMES